MALGHPWRELIQIAAINTALVHALDSAMVLCNYGLHHGIVPLVDNNALCGDIIRVGSISAPPLHFGVDGHGNSEHRRLDV
jgi:hypothetical protein